MVHSYSFYGLSTMVHGLIKQPKLYRMLNTFQFIEYAGIIAWFYVRNYITDLRVGHQKLAYNIDIMPGENIIYFGQYARYVFMDVD